jgi:hypothetical protein
METCYQIPPGKIAHQNIDGEVIVIHFDTGNYYSLNGSAAELWGLLDKPRNVASFAALFSDWDGQASQAVQRFLDELSSEQLVQRIQAQGVTVSNGAPVPFVPPLLEKYSDMQHLLLADPMHDVVEQGWPKVKA